MIILDTNVISELLRPEPNQQVASWLSAQDSGLLFLTTISEAELRQGVAILPEGKRRSALSKAIEGILEEDFRNRILSFDRQSAISYAAIASKRRAEGRPISQFDCQIAAIARSHSASVATRNINDYQGCGISLLNPWQSP
jgi:predicted nucleic acid-binding protein